MMFLLTTVIVLMLTGTQIDGQTIFLKLQSITTPCQQGLRRGDDEYLISGYVGQYLRSLGDGWKSTILIQVLAQSAEKFVEICSVFIGPAGMFCNESHRECRCDNMNTTTDSAHIVVHTFAKVSQSEAIVRAMWQHENGSSIFSFTNVTLPKIYDTNAASLRLRVNHLPSLHSDDCGRFFTPNTINNVELCCYHTATPCYPRISFNNIVVAESMAQCVNYTFSLNNESYSVNVTKSYSVCTLNDYITASTCILTTEPKISTEDEVLIIGLIIFAFCVIITIVIAIILIVKGPRPQRSSRASTSDELNAQQEIVESLTSMHQFRYIADMGARNSDPQEAKSETSWL